MFTCAYFYACAIYAHPLFLQLDPRRYILDYCTTTNTHVCTHVCTCLIECRIERSVVCGQHSNYLVRCTGAFVQRVCGALLSLDKVPLKEDAEPLTGTKLRLAHLDHRDPQHCFDELLNPSIRARARARVHIYAGGAHGGLVRRCCEDLARPALPTRCQSACRHVPVYRRVYGHVYRHMYGDLYRHVL